MRFLLIALLLVTSFQKNTEDILTDKIFKLLEVKQIDKQLKRDVGSNENVSIMVDASRSDQMPFYEIRVGYNGPLRFETRHNFRIDKKYVKSVDFEKHVEIMDFEGNYVPLLTWRKIKR